MTSSTLQQVVFLLQGANKGDLVETLHNMMGVYFHFKDEAVPEQVKSWNVKILALGRNDRHRDADVQREFFRHLQQFERR